MMSPGRAIAWTIWRRHRLGLSASAGCVIMAVAASAIFRALLESGRALEMAGIILTPLAVCALYLASVFSYGFESDLATAGTAFPTRQFTLPVRTSALVGWPIAFGTAAVALLWLIAAGLIFRPAGLDVPLGWPALLAAAELAWLQALVWWPFGLAWMRLVVGLLVGHLPISATMLALQLDLPEWAVCSGLVVALAVGLLAARTGLGRARRGEIASWEWLARLRPAVARRPAARTGFVSPGRALTWFEQRRHGLALPLMVALVVPLCLLSLFLEEPTPPLLVRNLALALLIPVFLAGMAGGQVGRSNPWVREQFGMSSFAATRPVTTAAMVAAKLRAAARTTVLTWAIVLTLTTVALFASGSHRLLGNMIQSWIDARPVAEVAGALAVGAVLLFLLTWKRMVESLMLEVIGRELMIRVMAIVSVFFTISAVVLVLWVVVHPEYHDTVRAATPWVLAGLAALKVALAAMAIAALRRKRLVADRTMLMLACVWLTVLVALFGTLASLIPAEMVPASTLACGLFLILPLARLSAMPLALDWNRHR